MLKISNSGLHINIVEHHDVKSSCLSRDRDFSTLFHINITKLSLMMSLWLE